MFPRVSAGDDPRVLLTNAEWLNGVSGLLEPPGIQSSGPPLLNVGRLPFACKVKNASGAAVGRYGILGIDDVIISKTDAAATFWGPSLELKGVKPKQAHAGRTAHALGPIDDGKIGIAIIPNAIQCQVNVVTATDRFASIIDDDVAKLRSGPTGHYPMIPAETGTGVKWAIVFLVGTSGALPDKWGEVTIAFTAATGWTPATWGTGTVQPKDEAGANDGPPIAVKNKYRDTFAVRSIVAFDPNFDPPRLKTVGCTVAP